mmetsp:Transcript_20463/g.24868  ORF Transcript_20463/g.24868 Transcript_20463/m.24868 type:complete len:335 (-) Transcript_20463:1011-2015(-)
MWSGLVDQLGQDLNEFVSTVKGDTSAVLNSVSEKIIQKTEGNKNDERVDGDGKKDGNSNESKKVNFEPFVAKLLQDPTVLLNDEIEQDSRFEKYASEFSLVEESEEINELLRDGCEVKTIYSEYVPSKITHKQFWIRYFFLESELRLSRHRVGEIQMQEEDLTWGHDVDEGWEDDDIDDDDVMNKVEETESGQAKSSNLKNNFQDSDSASRTDTEELAKQIKILQIDLENASKVIATLRKENTLLKAQVSSLSVSKANANEEVNDEHQKEGDFDGDSEDKNEACNVVTGEKKGEKEVARKSTVQSVPGGIGTRKSSANSSEDNGSWEEDFPEWE